MVKSYLRYTPYSTLGVLYSPGSNLLYDHSGKLGICPTLDSVSLWNLRQGTLISKLDDSDNEAEVTCLSLQSMSRRMKGEESGSYGNVLAVGYADGSIRVWNLERAVMSGTDSLMVTLRGHSVSVVSLAWENENGGTRLASGSRDGNLVIWDVPGEIGLCRLYGHKESITGLCFLDHFHFVTGSSYLISSSKDSTVKVWDLQLKHCVETITEHAAEVSGLALHPSLPLLVTGSLDSPSSFRLFKINLEALSNLSLTLLNHNTNDKGRLECVISYLGSLERKSGKEKPSQIQFHPSGRYLAVSGFEKTIDIFKILNEEEKRKLLRRKYKQIRERVKRREDKKEEVDSSWMDVFLAPIGELKYVTTIRLKHKLRSFSWSSCADVSLLIGNFHNQIVSYELPVSATEFIERHIVEWPGHRTEIKGVQFSYSGEMIATFSSVDGLIKIWNVRSGRPVRTMMFESLSPLQAMIFVPEDEHLVIAGSNGTLALVEIASGECIFSHTSAHMGGVVRSIVSLPDGSGFVSGGSDKLVHFWEYDLEKREETSRFIIQSTKSLQLPDEVVALHISPNGILLAISLLDSTIRIFYMDTLKLFLSLYGHKLPALALDVAWDSQMLVSVSADKSIRVWGLDFGNCRTSLFGHNEAILTVAFISKTHLVFTAGKDGFIKYWDLDKAVGSNGPICRLSKKPFASQVSALAVSPNGTLLVAISGDRAIRIFLRTTEPIFVEEEREKELEDLLAASVLSEDPRNKVTEEEKSYPHGFWAEDSVARTKTSTSLIINEQLFELIEVITEEIQLAKESFGGKPPVISFDYRHPMLLGLTKGRNSNVSVEFLLLEWMERVPTFELEQSLLLLSFSVIQSLFLIIETWFERGWNPILSARILIFLIQLHDNAIASSSSKSVHLALGRIIKLGTPLLSTLKHMFSFNKAVMELVALEWHVLHSTTPLFFSPLLPKPLPTTSQTITTTTTTTMVSAMMKRKKSAAR